MAFWKGDHPAAVPKFPCTRTRAGRDMLETVGKAWRELRADTCLSPCFAACCLFSCRWLCLCDLWHVIWKGDLQNAEAGRTPVKSICNLRNRPEVTPKANTDSNHRMSAVSCLQRQLADVDCRLQAFLRSVTLRYTFLLELWALYSQQTQWCSSQRASRGDCRDDHSDGPASRCVQVEPSLSSKSLSKCVSSFSAAPVPVPGPQLLHPRVFPCCQYGRAYTLLLIICMYCRYRHLHLGQQEVRQLNCMATCCRWSAAFAGLQSISLACECRTRFHTASNIVTLTTYAMGKCMSMPNFIYHGELYWRRLISRQTLLEETHRARPVKQPLQ